MKGFLERLRLNFIMTALLCIALGIVLIVFPETTSNVFCIVIGILLAVCGILRIGGYMAGETKTFGAKLMLVEGILLAIIGVFIIMKPEVIEKLISIIIGILLLFHGISDLKEAYKLKELNMMKWWVIGIIGIVTIGLGIFLISKSSLLLDELVKLMGIFLIVDGVTDVVVYGFWKHYDRAFRKNSNQSEKSIIEVVDGKVK